MNRPRRHPAPLLAVLLLLLAVAGGVVWKSAVPARSAEGPASPKSSTAEKSTPPAAGPEVAASPATTEPAKPISTGPDPDPGRYRRAYLLSLDGGKLSLQNEQDIEGDFAQRRGRQEEWSGMLRCRLLDAEGKVLAEELLPAPDHLCTVLDARDGTAKPVSYTVAGPVMFQLRMPRLNKAARLEVTRITGGGSLSRDQPVGTVNLAKS